MEYLSLINFCESVARLLDCGIRIYCEGRLTYAKTDDPKVVQAGIIALCAKLNSGTGFILAKDSAFVAVKDGNSESVCVFGPIRMSGGTHKEELFPVEYIASDRKPDAAIGRVDLAELANMLDIAINGDEREKEAVSTPTKSEIVKDVVDIRENGGVIPLGEQYEKKLVYIVKNGLVEELSKLDGEYLVGKIANYGGSYVRTLKNNMVVYNALLYRAAKSGGLERAVANATNEQYSRRIEKCGTVEQLVELSKNMRREYCQSVRDAKERSVDDPIVARAIKYIEKNLYSKIDASDVARELNVSGSYLSRKFKAVLDTSIPQFVSSLKIEEAKKLILFSEKTLSEISAILAFSSQSYFQQVFKRVVGKTPVEFKSDEIGQKL